MTTVLCRPPLRLGRCTHVSVIVRHGVVRVVRSSNRGTSASGDWSGHLASGAVKGLKRSLGFAASVVIVCLVGLPSAPALASSPECPNEQLRQESRSNPTTDQPYSAGLPECRAYEMVSPPEKGGSGALSIEQSGFPAAADGDAVGFLSQNAFGDAENAVSGVFGLPADEYIARRIVSGWVTSSALAPRGLIGKPALNTPDASPEDLSTVASCGLMVVNNATAGSDAVCAVDTPSDSWASTPDYSNLTGQPYSDFSGNAAISYIGGSSELNNVVFESDGGADNGAAFLTDDTSTNNGDGLYEVAGLGAASSQLRLVNVDDSGNEIGPNEGSRVGGISSKSGEATACEAHPASPAVSSSYHAISADGQKIYFTACPSNEGGGVNEIYARVAATSTVAISSPSPSQCTTCSPTPASAVFEGASADGLKAFFLTSQQLLNGDTDTTTDLYEYDFANPPGRNVVQLSAGGAGDLSPGSGAEVQGVVRTASDGSHVYFVARGMLTTVLLMRQGKSPRRVRTTYMPLTIRTRAKQSSWPSFARTRACPARSTIRDVPPR